MVYVCAIELNENRVWGGGEYEHKSVIGVVHAYSNQSGVFYTLLVPLFLLGYRVIHWGNEKKMYITR